METIAHLIDALAHRPASELVEDTTGERIDGPGAEEILLAHPDVPEVAVVGAHDPLYGEVVAAFLVPRPGAALDPGGIAGWCALRLADFKCPAQVTIVPELAKGPTGKILKGPLRTASLTLRSGSN